MNKTGLCGALLAVALLYGTVDDAAAQRRRSAFYSMAKKTSSALVSSSWKSLGRDCHNADKLVQIIGDGVDRVTKDLRSGRRFRGRMAVDFGNGYIDGLVTTLDDVVNKCSNECSTIGKASGEWSAEIFCAVSEVINKTAEFDGLVDRPNLVCGEAYRQSCESSFIGTAQSSCRKYAKGNNFYNYYSANRGGCCSYDVRD